MAVNGELQGASEQFTKVNVDAVDGQLTWTGVRYGVVWSDRRHQNYEIFFSLSDPFGKKRIADLRLSHRAGFSVYPAMVVYDSHFVVAWQDDRDGAFQLYARRIGLDGKLVGPESRLDSSSSTPNEAPHLA